MCELPKALAANADYADSFPHPEDMPGRPTRSLAVLTCMDCRLEPEKALGIRVPEANIIRNAGGRASPDALRSLVVATRLLGADEILVVHHSDCGMAAKDQEGIVAALSTDAESAQAAAKVDWLTIADQEQALKSDLAVIRDHPLIDAATRVHGLILNPKTGSADLVEAHPA